MKLLVMVVILGTLGACSANSPALTPSGTPAPAKPNDTQSINDEYVAKLLASIAGRENEPAENVFANVQWLKGVPAGRFLRIMNGGYSRALGVTCVHCHVASDFASDELRPKRAAREMAVMHRSINEKLRTMQNLASEPSARAINCAVCHRGQVNPMAENQ